MITISNISFFRFCWKNRKLDWPKCVRTVCLHWLVTNKPQSASLKENASTQNDSENFVLEISLQLLDNFQLEETPFKPKSQ